MSSRREFIAGVSIIGLSGPLKCSSSTPVLENDEFDWSKIRSEFLVNPNEKINLNNGSGTITPIPILDKYYAYLKEINAFAPYEVHSRWSNLEKEGLTKLSNLIGAENGSLTIVLNTTTALNSIISGLPFNAGDRIIMNSSDYPNAINAIKNRALRDNLIIDKLNLDFKNLSNEEIVDAYKNAIQANTKLLYLTHITHAKGHIYPIKEICDAAKAKGVEVLVDGAHAVGQIPLSLSDIDCDYFASSLHKWTNAPLGTGLLYVKKDKIEKVNPIQAFPNNLKSDGLKFEYLGTRPFQNLAIINDVMDYLNNIGIEKKQERFIELKQYWLDKIKDHEEIIIASDPNRTCGIASFELKNIFGSKAIKVFENKYGIHLKLTKNVIDKHTIFRVSPDIYNNFSELDVFTNAVIEIAES